METTGAVKAVKKITDTAAVIAGRIKTLSGPLLKVLTFNPASDSIAPASALCLQIGNGRVYIIYAFRSFSRFRIKAGRSYRFTDDSLPSPSEVASTMAVAAKDLGIRRASVHLIIPKSLVAMKAASL